MHMSLMYVDADDSRALDHQKKLVSNRAACLDEAQEFSLHLCMAGDNDRRFFPKANS